MISSHILSELEKIASCYGFISKGHLIEEISVEELQRRCRKSLSIKVDKVDAAENALTKLGIKDYKVMPNGDVMIYDNININKIVLALSTAQVNILSINSSDESVEDYYLNLVREREAR